MEDLAKQAGNPTWQINEATKLIYQLPVSPKDERAILVGRELTQGIPESRLRMVGPFLTASCPETHIGPFLHAIDFLVPDGTTVFASRDGEVNDVVECHDEWGNGPEFRYKLNYVTLKHHDSKTGMLEFSQYCHLFKGSVSTHGLRLGSKVKVGQPIGSVGKTGWTDRDHLHFIVFRLEKDNPENPFGFRSLEIKFKS